MSTFLKKNSFLIVLAIVAVGFLPVQAAFAQDNSTGALVQCALDNTVAPSCGECPSKVCYATADNGTVQCALDNTTAASCDQCPSKVCYATNDAANAAATTATVPTTNTSNSSGLLQNPLQAPDLATLLVEILGYVTKIGTIFLIIMLMYVGFQFVVAQGAPEAVSKARSALLWTAVGGLLLLGAQAIAIVIASTVAGL